jgi:prepilin-type N-terminal cleavage/methylation domain-containing protein
MRKAFTLIELIFVIVIIGLLAAVAVPKFVNLKQNAQASTVVKTTVDTAQQAVEAAINERDLEENSTYTLKDLVTIKGKDWNYTTSPADGNYSYTDPLNNKVVASVILDKTNNKVEYTINCDNFKDTGAKDKCKKLIGQDSVDVNITY